MAYVISDECISCGSCVDACPVEAISEGADHYEIDPNVVRGDGFLLGMYRGRIANCLSK